MLTLSKINCWQKIFTKLCFWHNASGTPDRLTANRNYLTTEALVSDETLFSKDTILCWIGRGYLHLQAIGTCSSCSNMLRCSFVSCIHSFFFTLKAVGWGQLWIESPALDDNRMFNLPIEGKGLMSLCQGHPVGTMKGHYNTGKSRNVSKIIFHCLLTPLLKLSNYFC